MWICLGGGAKMLPLLISKRESFLKLGCSAVLAANATRGDAIEMWFSDEERSERSEIPACQKESCGSMFAADVNLLL